MFVERMCKGRKETNLSLLLWPSLASTVSQYSSYISGITFAVTFFCVKLLSPPVGSQMPIQQISKESYLWPESLLHKQVPHNAYLKTTRLGMKREGKSEASLLGE